MSHFLHKIKVLKNGFCRREIFCELISVTEMEAYRNEHTHLNLVEDVFYSEQILDNICPVIS